MACRRARLEDNIVCTQFAIDTRLRVLNEFPTPWNPDQIWRMIDDWRGQIRRAREELDALQTAR